MFEFYPVVKDIVIALWTVGVFLIGYLAFVLRGIRGDLRLLGDRLIAQEVLRATHQTQDDERHQRLQHDVDTIYSMLRTNGSGAMETHR